LSRPFPSRSNTPQYRINGKIRAREVRVIGPDGGQLGILTLGDAINQARAIGVDLVEIAPTATPPVCRIVDFGKFRYELAKKDKGVQRPASKLKEVQLSASIDPHDFGVKLTHAIDFLCEEMKVKISLRFRGREMAHKEFGFQVVKKFIEALTPYAHADSEPKLIGRGINVMVSPLPRNKRAKNPNEAAQQAGGAATKQPLIDVHKPIVDPLALDAEITPAAPEPPPAQGFVNNPFTQLDKPSPPESGS
jgi:translation initiation factor IF-3